MAAKVEKVGGLIDNAKPEGEATTPPSPDLGNHLGAQVARQRCPILRTTKHISASP